MGQGAGTAAARAAGTPVAGVTDMGQRGAVGPTVGSETSPYQTPHSAYAHSVPAEQVCASGGVGGESMEKNDHNEHT